MSAACEDPTPASAAAGLTGFARLGDEPRVFHAITACAAKFSSKETSLSVKGLTSRRYIVM